MATYNIPRGSYVYVSETSVADAIANGSLGELKGNTVVTVDGDKEETKSSTGAVLREIYRNLKATLSAELFNIDYDNISALNDGLFTKATVAASPVAGATQTIASGSWSYDGFIAIENQNGDGSEITVNSVTLGTDGAIVEDTDFFVMKSGGIWGIYIIDSATVTTESQSVVIDYDYTPAANTTWSAGSSAVSITPRIVVARYTDESGNTTDYILWAARQSNGISITLFDQAESGLQSIPIELEGDLDTSRADGSQLIQIKYTAA